ncbi:MAG: hypothetical protein ABWX68_08110 [Arthrobacter sp.]|uniref:hypothetical protein n=1 Tax=Arthrobacter sp. TaxID=1667 RepID=UPI003498944A
MIDRTASGEQGQTLILVIGYVAIALLAVSATLAATAVNTEARRLLSVADGAVVAAADSFSVAGGGEGAPLDLVLTDAAVRSAAAAYVADTGAPARFDGFAVLVAAADGDGATARVRLGASVRPPIVGWFVPEGIPISVESSARTALER